MSPLLPNQPSPSARSLEILSREEVWRLIDAAALPKHRPVPFPAPALDCPPPPELLPGPPQRRSPGPQRSAFTHLPPSVTGLPKESVANVSQLVTLDKADLTERTGKLSRTKLELVLSGIDVVLGR